MSVEGPPVPQWEPYPALRKWESMGDRGIQIYDPMQMMLVMSECVYGNTLN